MVREVAPLVISNQFGALAEVFEDDEPERPEADGEIRRLYQELLHAMVKDTQNRMITQKEFDAIEQSLGVRFELDACCNVLGTNSLCQKSCSMVNSFLQFDCAGMSVWLNPPWEDPEPFVRHYLDCKNWMAVRRQLFWCRSIGPRTMPTCLRT